MQLSSFSLECMLLSPRPRLWSRVVGLVEHLIAWGAGGSGSLNLDSCIMEFKESWIMYLYAMKFWGGWF
jgi:hypothetical protein